MIRSLFKSFFKKKPQSQGPSSIPFKGYTEGKNIISFIDYLSDQELGELNSLLDWKAFVVDGQGRRFGNIAWSGKRMSPQLIPDPRHEILNARIPLRDKKILEIGCFEGIHTISLCRLAKEVVAIDSRIENVIKTIVRCNLFNEKPTVFKCDVEQWDADTSLLRNDVCHHIGVLYHLLDPVQHLIKLCSLISTAIYLDTHIAVPTDELSTYMVNGKSFRYKKYLERGRADVFSGMYDHAKWLLLDDLKEVLASCGFSSIEVIEERAERNGPRVLLLAQKP